MGDRGTLLVSRNLLESLLDPEDCRFDHHGGCQEHGYLSLEWRECPMAEIKRLLSEEEAPGQRPTDSVAGSTEQPSSSSAAAMTVPTTPGARDDF
jgi:hypothetical protein